MPRFPRIYIEGVLYYVTSRSDQGQNLFVDSQDYQEYISLIDKYKRQYGFRLFAYVLLPTHLHMLIELKHNVPISNIMHDINSLYTKMFNSRYGKKGHLFQERFRTLLAEKESYLLPLARHIHLNPQRSKLVSSPQEYLYSSYLHFLNPEKRQYPDMRREITEVFILLKGREEMFARYVQGQDQRQFSEFSRSLRKKRVLGSREFGERIKKLIEESAKVQRRPLTKRARLIYIASTAATVLLAASAIVHFYRRSLTLQSEYDKTIALYVGTLRMLKKEMAEALKAKADVQNYQWKIKLTEEALAQLKAERARARKEKKKIEGYAWRIKLRQIGGAERASADIDVIHFKDNRLNSANLSREGFLSSSYSTRELKNGNIVWETMQRNSLGETASWRGEWDGQRMKGVLSRRSAKGVARDFSFVSAGERKKR